MLVPETADIFMPSDSRTSRTPICANPLAPPPLRARPIFFVFLQILDSKTFLIEAK